MKKSSIKKRLERIESLLVEQKKVLNFIETTKFLNVSKSHLYKLTSSREIPHSKPNGKRIYFNREELEKWMLRNKIKSNDEIETDAANYIMRHPRKF